MKIAYIIYSGTEKYLPENNFNEVEDLLPLLQSRGLDITAEIWDNPETDWKKYDVALLKTPWDYHEKYEQFIVWLDTIEALGIKLLNNYDIVRWNMDKHYLAEVGHAGFNVIPTIFLQKGWKEALEHLFTALQTTELIIKPCVSAGSKNTIVIHKANMAGQKETVWKMLLEGDYMAQPLMHEVKEGEWSFVFFNGKHSHTIIKKPLAGDFRVQQIYGGTITPVKPEKTDIDCTAAYLQQFAKNAFYARVDGLMVNGKFVLMELELIEPFLYLSYSEKAVENYYAALKEQLSVI